MFKVILYYFLITILTGCLLNQTNYAKTPNIYYKQHTYSTRITYESIHSASDDPLGLMGVHYEINSFLLPKLYLGIGGYGALVGDYGGFFTAGITPGFRFTFLKDYSLDLGLFLGGGGGASAFPGDGEMIRAHAYLGYTINKSTLWLGINKQQISKTVLPSSLSIGYSSQLEFLLQTSQQHRSKLSLSPILNKYNLSINPSYTFYFPTSLNQGRNSTNIDSKIGLLSLDVSKQINKNWSGIISLSGSNDAPADGYGAIFVGSSYEYKLNKVSLFSKLKIGMAGGGNIDTGGGLLIHPQIETQFHLNKQYALASSLGYIIAPSGTFESWQSSLGITYKATLNSLKTASDNIISIKKKSPYNFTWFIENKSTFPVQDIYLKSGKKYEEVIQFFGCGLAFSLNSFTNAIVSTYWAYDGEVGAYAEGNFGLNSYKKITSNVSLGLEVLLGAAGGGGINVNTGTIHQETVNLSYALSNNKAFIFKLGSQGAFSNDSFHGTVVTVGVENKVNLF